MWNVDNSISNIKRVIVKVCLLRNAIANEIAAMS